MALPDISDYYDEEDHALDEHLSWVMARDQDRELDWLLPRFMGAGLTSAVEYGPGSGILANKWIQVCPKLKYTGIEKSLQMLQLAKNRLVHTGDHVGALEFREGDIRQQQIERDCAVAFSFVKHFGLHEWDDILGIVLASGRYAAFDMQIMDRDLDNGVDFHHTFVTEERLMKVVRRGNHEIVESKVMEEANVQDEGRMKKIAYWTRRLASQ